jgi:hypothetical protein
LFFFVLLAAVFSVAFISGCTRFLAPEAGEKPASNPPKTGSANTKPPNITPPNSGPAAPASQKMVWYVSAGGTDSNSGTDPAKPAASVQAALGRIKSLYRSGKWPAGESAVIVISGTITASSSFGSNMSMVDVSGKGNYPPIILKGDPVQKGILNANRNSGSQGRVLYIANNKVTLEDNLLLTGGYTLWGGAVCVGTHGSPTEGEFIMAGGTIGGNTAGIGGGVLVYKGSMTMTGGIIENNTPAIYSKVMGSGGGVYVNEAAAFTMTGGTIRDNGGADTDKGGGVFINGAVFTMSGGEIINNTSTVSGGGVRVTPYGQFIMTGGTISGNTSASDGGVSVPHGAVFNKTGGTVSGNTPN